MKLERQFANLISADSAKQYVRDLVAFGPRLGGTRSNEKAAKYLHAKFSTWGLKSRIVLDPEQLTHEESDWQLELMEPEQRAFNRPWPYRFSPATLPRETPVVLFSRNTNRELLSAKTVLVETFLTHQLYEELVAAGVVAILSEAPARHGDFTEWARIGQLPSRDDNPIPAFAISRSDGQYVRNLIAAGKIPIVKFSLHSRIFKARPQTVIAEIPARQTTDAYFIYCAHGDSDAGGPGADDNASGVAVVLETARVLQKLLAEAVIPPPTVAIRFILWGSEYHSANAYIAAQREGLEHIAGVINFDQAGTGSLFQAIYFEGNDVPWNEKLLRTLAAICEQYCGEKGFWQRCTTNPSQGGTDSYAFLPPAYRGMLKQKNQIPATTIYTAAWDTPGEIEQPADWHSDCWSQNVSNGSQTVQIDYSRYYHSSGDIPEWTTDMEPWRMAWCAKAGGLALLRLAWQREQSN